MIIVTGAAGFIGSNIIDALNKQGHFNILAVDNLTDGKKFKNLASVRIADYLDQDAFLAMILNNDSFAESIEVIFHDGACSTTTEWNGRYMMENNYEYSKKCLHYCLEHQIPFIYASSAAVYGNNQYFEENISQQFPLNVYGYSKWLFDIYVQPYLASAKSQIVGLRYFNVYGPREQHKGSMASVAYHFFQQLEKDNKLKLFAGSLGYSDGEHLRDFVYVNDVAEVNLWFWKHPDRRGIFNCGTGQARSFNELAKIMIEVHGSGSVEYVPFPDHLLPAYQSFTQADLTALRLCGYQQAFTPLEEGIAEYYRWYQQDQYFR